MLYGIWIARAAAAKAGKMILAEGYTDVMALHQAGVTHAVGIMGTSLTKEQVAELVRIVGTLELCLDADRAGQDAMVRAAQLCADQKLELRVVPLPVGADPGDLIKSDGAPALRARVATSVPFVAFEVERVLGRADLGSAEGKDRAIRELRPAFAGVPASVLRDELVGKAAGALGLDEARFVTLLDVGGGAGPVGPPPGGFRSRPPLVVGGSRVIVDAELGVRSERSYLAMCLAAGHAGAAELARIDPEHLFSSGVLRRAARHLAGQLEVPADGTEADDVELNETLTDLRKRAESSKGSGKDVDADQLEHARLLLEMACIDRAIARARVDGGAGIVDLAGERQRIRQALGTVVSRIERPAS